MWCELTCDNCGYAINHYAGRPSKEMLVEDGVIIVGNRHFCSEDCYDEWKNNKQNKRNNER
jgi:hypothetical protein